jgi:hypothetical protein
MTYCILVFQLGRTVEPHPFGWHVAPACYAHGVLSRDADETVIVPGSGGVQAPPHVPADVEAARARGELGAVEPADHVPLLFWTRADRGTRLPASVADACQTEGVLRAGETVTDAREVARNAMTAGIRDAVAEAHDRENAAGILDYAAQHNWYPECSLPTAYEQYLITDALAALRDLHDRGIPVPQAHAAAAGDLQRRAAREEASSRV